MSITGLTFNSLPSIDSEALEIPFFDEEVLVALYSLNGDKTPKLNGFIDILTVLLGFCEKERFWGSSRNSINQGLLRRV